MTDLRIRIPKVDVCQTPDCIEYTTHGDLVCRECKRNQLETWMSEKVAPTTFPCESQLIHSTPLRRFLSG
jgi:hypothetical protein